MENRFGIKWLIKFFVVFILLLVIAGGYIVWIDPFFHYHSPLEQYNYKLYNERYQNDGIVQHFQYDALITGTSMTQNFKTSELDELFDVNGIKVPFSGASYKEINMILTRALKKNDDIKMVVRGLDYNAIWDEPDHMRYDDYPYYLYNDNPLDDAEYVFNKIVLINSSFREVLLYTKHGGISTSFDEYENWNANYEFGKEAVLSGYERPTDKEETASYTYNTDNLKENVLKVVDENPETEFYFFWTPYSILFFDALNQSGRLEEYLNHESDAVELLLERRNVHIFSFFDDFI